MVNFIKSVLYMFGSLFGFKRPALFGLILLLALVFVSCAIVFTIAVIKESKSCKAKASVTKDNADQAPISKEKEALATTKVEAKETAEETAEEAGSEEPAGKKDDEVDVVSTEGAEESSDSEEKDPIVIPVIVPVDTDEGDEDGEEDDEEDEDDEDEDDGVNVAIVAADGDNDAPGFGRSRYTRTYAAKLIQADDELKGYYSAVKNAFMSYKKVTCSVSREHERVRRGRTTIGIIKVRGKSLLVYLALDPAQFENTMYVGEDVSSISKYASTPFLYRVKGPRKAARAVKLISMLAEKIEMVPTAVPANEDYIARFPYEDTDALVEKGLIIDNIAEAERKAEEARIAAEEAEAAANKAIEDAIKAKEHATKVSERSERTVDEIEATEEAKAAKQGSTDNK